MIPKSLKQDLDQLKFIIAKEMNATLKLSYGEEINFLIKNLEGLKYR